METAKKQSAAAAASRNRFRRPLLYVVSLAILAGGYFIVLAQPLRVYQVNSDLLHKLEGDIALANAALETSKGFASKIYRLTPLEKKLLDMALPLKSDDSALVAQITSLAQKAGFSVSSLDVVEANGRTAGTVSSDQIGKISLRLKLRGGGYAELKRFFGLVESSLMMLDVQSVSFTDKSSVYDLTMAAYYYKGPASADKQ